MLQVEPIPLVAVHSLAQCINVNDLASHSSAIVLKFNGFPARYPPLMYRTAIPERSFDFVWHVTHLLTQRLARNHLSVCEHRQELSEPSCTQFTSTRQLARVRALATTRLPFTIPCATLSRLLQAIDLLNITMRLTRGWCSIEVSQDTSRHLPCSDRAGK
jgi:hypothetical protein